MDDRLRARLRRPDPLVTDGGLGTTLAANGHDLRDDLWSARLLLDDPEAIRSVHVAFVEAGAEVITSSSYQLAARSLEAAGRDPGLAPSLLRRSVELAREAVDAARRGSALVAASVGPYGAALADGSEYRGRYGVTTDDLAAFHAPRIEALLAAGPDLLAIETLPSASEVAAIARVLAGTGVDAWVTVTLGGDGSTIAEGQPLREALEPVFALDEVVAVGVNCCPPELVSTALAELADCGRPLVVYPNVGQRWEAERRTWSPPVAGAEPPVDPRTWAAAGARLIGGCCGTSPADISRLAGDLAA